MSDIFLNHQIEENEPLASKMCPKSLEEFVGQRHLIGEGKLLRRAIEADRVTSLILYGPPGSGKTALSKIIATRTKSTFEQINAVTSNLAAIRKVIQEAKHRKFAFNKKTILFIDEIHRFNKAQQDGLLPDVEKGTVILIGTTTHNPYFYIISPLLSRSMVFELYKLEKEDLKTILKYTLKDDMRGLAKYKVNFTEEALNHLVTFADGDARKALNALELGVLTTNPNKEGVIIFDLKVAEESIQRKAIVYDRGEDGHYDTISAFIKSMRGSDPDAALYWLAKMLYAGEDPRFIARRIVICAAEDVGNADPQALVLANAALQVAEFIGMPEARIPLAQAVVYIATAPKSNASYLGITAAMADVEHEQTQEVPLHLKENGYPGAKNLKRGEGYKYPHDYKNHFVEQTYIPCQKKYYSPGEIGYEKEIKKYLETLKNATKTNFKKTNFS